jgi:predicted Zn-dependent protease
VDLNPNLYGLHRDFGAACLKMGRGDDALEHLKIALQQDPEDVMARKLLARTEE